MYVNSHTIPLVPSWYQLDDLDIPLLETPGAQTLPDTSLGNLAVSPGLQPDQQVAVAVAICRADNLRPTVQVLIQSLAGALTQPSICFPLTAPLTKVSSHVNPGDHRRLSMGLFRPEYLRLCHHFNCALGVFEKTPLPHSSAGDIIPWLVLSISQRDYLFRSNFTGFIILLRILDTRSPTACPTWACLSERVVV